MNRCSAFPEAQPLDAADEGEQFGAFVLCLFCPCLRLLLRLFRCCPCRCRRFAFQGEFAGELVQLFLQRILFVQAFVQ